MGPSTSSHCEFTLGVFLDAAHAASTTTAPSRSGDGAVERGRLSGTGRSSSQVRHDQRNVPGALAHHRPSYRRPSRRGRSGRYCTAGDFLYTTKSIKRFLSRRHVPLVGGRAASVLRKKQHTTVAARPTMSCPPRFRQQNLSQREIKKNKEVEDSENKEADEFKNKEALCCSGSYGARF